MKILPSFLYNLLRTVYRGYKTAKKVRFNERLKKKVYRSLPPLEKAYREAESPQGSNDGPIWVSWWQGEEEMPELVKVCYHRLLAMAPPSRPVVLITKDTYSRYIELPEHILKAVEEGRMGLPHFSDVIRMGLLTKHGGLWLDSTIYVARPIEERLFTLPYYTVKLATPIKEFVSRSLFTMNVLAAPKGAPWFAYTYDFLTAYWKQYDHAIDYSITDIGLILGYDNIPSVQRDVERNVEAMEHHISFLHKVNEAFDAAEYESIIRDTPFLKLTYKWDLRKTTPEGAETYYGYLCRESAAGKRS